MPIVAVLLSLLCWSSLIQANHFYGGTITWRYSNFTDSASPDNTVFTQSYQWRQSQTLCDQSVIDNRTQIPAGTDLLQCVTGACGGYSSSSVSGYCTDFDLNLTSSASQVSYRKNITIGSSFCVAYQGATWPRLRSPGCAYSCFVNESKGSIGTCVNFTPRPDGSINSPPVVAIVSRKFQRSIEPNNELQFFKLFVYRSILLLTSASPSLMLMETFYGNRIRARVHRSSLFCLSSGVVGHKTLRHWMNAETFVVSFLEAC